MNRQQRIPLDWFVCPITKAPLKPSGDSLVSPDGVVYEQPGSKYWDFLPQRHPELERTEWKIWEQLQANGVVSYKADPEHNLGIGKRQDFLQFADFCRFRGNVLDVGVGPQRCPTHIEYAAGQDSFFVGIDPLVGEQPRCFQFVRGLGEYLPFRPGLFDQVLFVTSLDHFIDPRPPLREASRVLRTDGEICVWIGEKARNAPKPTKSNDWYESLKVPPGADDRFHFKRFTAKEFEGYAKELGLSIADFAAVKIDQWRSNLFYRMRATS